MNVKAQVFVNIHAMVEGVYDNEKVYMTTEVTIVDAKGVPVLEARSELEPNEVALISNAMVIDTLRTALDTINKRMKDNGIEAAACPMLIPEEGVKA